MEYGISLPFGLKAVDGKPTEQVFPPAEIILERRDKQTLSEPPRAAQKVDGTIVDQIINKCCLVYLHIATLYYFFKVLYADRIPHSWLLVGYRCTNTTKS